jgi:hypothetical protein
MCVGWITAGGGKYLITGIFRYFIMLVGKTTLARDVAVFKMNIYH